MITRLISLVPSVIVAVAVGRQGINTLLVASQVVLSVVLPFVAFPLIYLTSAEAVMRVRRPPPEVIESIEKPTREDINPILDDALVLPDPDIQTIYLPEHIVDEKAEINSIILDEYIDYSNGRWLMAISYAIWSVVILANGYAIVSLLKKVEAK